MTPEALARLSTLLDEALDLDEVAREAWLAALPDDAAELAPTLRRLLARQAVNETHDLLERPPRFTPAGGMDTSPATFQPGDIVGPYRLLRSLGHGGMGEVWQAERADGTLKRKVALKLPHVSWTPGLAERFAREREILASLEHSNIARLYDAGLDAHGRPYMALEYVEGLPIDAFCSRRTLPVEARLRLLLQVADAVAFAHSRLVIHRDLKPGNILVTDDGQVRLLDFGIAKLMEGDRTRETALTQAAGRALTLDYASPEQIRGEPIGTASDVYSLGVVAFELLAGQRPHKPKRPSAAALEEAIATVDAPLASTVADDPALKKRLAGDLDAILNQALKKTATERYATVDAFAQDLRRHLDGHAVSARPDTLAYRFTRLLRRYRVPVAATVIAVVAFALALGVGATALVIFVLLLGLGAALWQAGRAREQARIARKEARTAAAVQAFVLDIFRANNVRQKDPLQAQKTTARELLDIGTERIAEALRDAPESRLEVLVTLSDMYYELGLRHDAARLTRDATELARQVFGPDDARFAKFALHCAEKLEESAERGEIPALLEAADAALVASGQASSAERAELLFRLARHYRYQSLPALMRTAEEAALLVAQTMADKAPQMVIDSRRHAGRAQIEAGRFDRAEPHYREAVRLAALAEHGRDSAMSLAKAELGEVMQKLGRIDEAESLGRESVEHSMRAHGPGHRWTLIVTIRLSNVLMRIGRVDEALRLREHVTGALAEERPEYDEQFRADMGGYLARMLLERGRPDRAEALVRVDLEDLRRHFPLSGSLASREADLADILTALGRYDEALALADEATQQWQRFSGGAGEPVRRDYYTLVAARALLAAGRPHDARARLAELSAPATAEQGRYEPARDGWDVEPARVSLAVGEAEAARGAARAALDEVRRHFGGRAPYAEARLLLVLGQALCKLGEPGEADGPLVQAVALRRRHDDAASLWLAEAQIALAECRALQGRRSESRALLGEAQAIHAQHEAVAPHLVAALEAALRTAGAD